MRTAVITNGTQKDEIVAAAKACGLSASSFLKMAAKEKINRMGIQINTSQGANLDSSAPSNQVKGVDANARIHTNV